MQSSDEKLRELYYENERYDGGGEMNGANGFQFIFHGILLGIYL